MEFRRVLFRSSHIALRRPARLCLDAAERAGGDGAIGLFHSYQAWLGGMLELVGCEPFTRAKYQPSASSRLMSCLLVIVVIIPTKVSRGAHRSRVPLLRQ